jgi:hypothetical protein
MITTKTIVASKGHQADSGLICSLLFAQSETIGKTPRKRANIGNAAILLRIDFKLGGFFQDLLFLRNYSIPILLFDALSQPVA